MGLEKMSTKILVAGDTGGKFARLMKTVGNAHAKAGPFDAVFCVGAFFGPTSHKEMIPYLTGQAKVPVPTFFICGGEPEGELPFALPEDGTELFPNCTYLGRQGVRTLECCGLRVGYLSGVHDAAAFDSPRPEELVKDEMAFDRCYRAKDVESLRTKCDGQDSVDLLLTAEWGRGFDGLLPASPLATEAPAPSPAIGSLMEVAAPRYHFAGTAGVHYTAQPYQNTAPAPAVTRFYGLGKCGNPTKVKALQALGIKLRKPLMTAADREAMTEVHSKATPNPYTYAREHGTASSAAAATGGAVKYFLPSPGFAGARAGYEFKVGTLGLGYYRTDGSGELPGEGGAEPTGPLATGPRVMGAEGPPPPKRLYVGGLSYSADDEALRDTFGRYGTLSEATVIMVSATVRRWRTCGLADARAMLQEEEEDRGHKKKKRKQDRAIWDTGEEPKRRGRSRGFGFVTFDSADAAVRAMEQLHNATVDGLTHGKRKLKVKPHVEQGGAGAESKDDPHGWGNVAKRFPGMAAMLDGDEDEELDSGRGEAPRLAGPPRPEGAQPDAGQAPQRSKYPRQF